MTVAAAVQRMFADNYSVIRMYKNANEASFFMSVMTYIISSSRYTFYER